MVFSCQCFSLNVNCHSVLQIYSSKGLLYRIFSRFVNFYCFAGEL
jgi:hypothetical protein